jgi:hypothetical protein
MLIEESENLHTDKILTVASVQRRDIKRPGHEIRHFCDNKAIIQQLRREKTPDKLFTFICSVLGLLMVLAIGSTLALAQEGGQVLPGKAHPHGYSLNDMLIASAVFNFGGSNPAKASTPIPNTPFQILFANLSDTTFTSLPCGGVTAHGHGFYIPFVVKSGTPFYVPLIGVDDSPPVLGTFPTTASPTSRIRGAKNYFRDVSR